jgi:hypothetical protein
MKGKKRDVGLDNLLDLNGQIFVIDPYGKLWVKFSVKQVAPTPEKPHGLSYSLTLHDEAGNRLVGFDNAHPAQSGTGPGAKARRNKEFDHKHQEQKAKPYQYKSAEILLGDFWSEVDKVLKKRGVV